MLIKTQGIVIKQRSIGESDKMLTILTKDYGLIEVSARGIKKLKSQLAGASQILCYSDFYIFQGKKYNVLNSAETINSFYDLRLDVKKVALASYFCDLTSYLAPSGERSWVYLRLLLNTLYLLENDKKDMNLLKSIYEFRCMSLAGFMPDLVCCDECKEYEKEKMYFLPLESKLICDDCLRKLDAGDERIRFKYTLGASVLQSMRHIIYSDDEKVFSFNLKEDSLKKLNFITENYVKIYCEREFKSLDVYKQMI